MMNTSHAWTRDIVDEDELHGSFVPDEPLTYAEDHRREVAAERDARRRDAASGSSGSLAEKVAALPTRATEVAYSTDSDEAFMVSRAAVLALIEEALNDLRAALESR